MLQTSAGKAGTGCWLWLGSLGSRGLSTGHVSWTLRGVGSRAQRTEEGIDCRQVSFCWSPNWLRPGGLNPEGRDSHIEERQPREACGHFPGEPAA